MTALCAFKEKNLAHIRTFRSKKLHPEHVKLLNEAIRHNARGKDKDVHITYRKENGEVSKRKVRPLAVKGKSLFVAHCHKRDAIRSFRVERIDMVKKAFWDGFEKRAGLLQSLFKKNIADEVKRAINLQVRSPIISGRKISGAFEPSPRIALPPIRPSLPAMAKKAFWDGFEKRAQSFIQSGVSSLQNAFGGGASAAPPPPPPPPPPVPSDRGARMSAGFKGVL